MLKFDMNYTLCLGFNKTFFIIQIWELLVNSFYLAWNYTFMTELFFYQI